MTASQILSYREAARRNLMFHSDKHGLTLFTVEPKTVTIIENDLDLNTGCYKTRSLSHSAFLAEYAKCRFVPE